MKVSSHFAVSIFIAVGFWFLTKSVYTALISFFSGVLVDIDHIADYVLNHGLGSFNMPNLFQACKQTHQNKGDYRFRRLYLVFHMMEIAISLLIISVITRNIYILAISVGYSTHLFMDCVGNCVYPNTYFMANRLVKGFNIEDFYRKGL